MCFNPQRDPIKHWHQSEDELVYVLHSEVTAIEGDEVYVLFPGDAATFPRGVAAGHYLWNKCQSVAKCMVVGTRAQVDQIFYPDHDRVLHRDRSLPDDIWTDSAGHAASDPYETWSP